MNSQEIKQYIYENDKIEYILEELNMHHIKAHDSKRYYTCGMPNGDNQKSTVVWNDEFFNIEAYTRNIKDKYGNSDIIALICFIKKIYFTEAIKWLCEILGLDYYSSPEEDLPESLKWTKMIQQMSIEYEENNDENAKLQPINEKILKYYKPYVNDFFHQDGISYETQKLFEIGYDLESNRITIPIRDELGTLVGIKGRLYKTQIEEWENKYLYLERCAKNKLLFGLDKSMPYIKEKNKVFVVEAEKGVMQGYSNGVPNIVSIGSHTLSKWQIEKLTQLAVEEIIICYDEDAFKYENKDGEQIKLNKEDLLKGYGEEVNKFITQQKVSVMVDLDENILSHKESPTDNFEKFWKLYDKRILVR